MTQHLTDFYTEYLVLPYIATFVFLTYGLRGIIETSLKNLGIKWFKTRYVVFVIALLFGLPFKYLGYDIVQILVSYAVGTSLYELVIDSLVKTASNFFNNKQNDGKE